MENKKYYTIDEAVRMIGEPNQGKCIEFMDRNSDLLASARGSLANHQAWEGGYLAHVEEVMNIATVLYPALGALRPHEFSLSDSLLVLFLHDLEKPWKYTSAGGQLAVKPEMKDLGYVKKFVHEKIAEYGFALTDEHKIGLEYVEGEIGRHSLGKRGMNPLAAFCNMCDTWSARGWYDFPRERGGW